MIPLSFAYPLALLLVVAAPVVLWKAKASGWGHKSLRLAVMLAIILGLSAPSVQLGGGPVVRVIVLDQSSHLSAAERERARNIAQDLIRNAPADDVTSLVQLGGEALDLGADRERRIEIDRAHVDLSDAAEAGLAAVPMGTRARLTLISDGRFGDPLGGGLDGALVQRLRLRGLSVDVAGIRDVARPPHIAAMTAAPVRTGETAQVLVHTEGRGRGLSVKLWSDGRLVARSEAFDLDGEGTVSLSFTSGRPGFQVLEAQLAVGQDGPVQDEMKATMAVQDPVRVLHLHGGEAGAGDAVAKLLGAGFQVTSRRETDPPPHDALVGFDVVLLDDVSPYDLSPSAQSEIANHVRREGMGLVYTGGDRAFASDKRRASSPLLEALPIRLKPEQAIERPSTALAIVIDSSGSMSGAPLDLAKQVARYAVRDLTPADSVGVVEFYGGRQWAFPMQALVAPADAERAIGRMQAEGSSMLFPALQEGYFALKNVAARTKHLMIVSDAGVAEARYDQLLRHIGQDGVTVSTILVGDEAGAEERMARWARLGRGRFYQVNSAFDLVALDFATPRTVASPPFEQKAFALRVLNRSRWFGDVDPTGLPMVDGYARVTARPGAEIALAGPEQSPFLASWQYGAGRTTVLAAPLLQARARGLSAWADYGQWVGGLVSGTAQTRNGPVVSLQRAQDGHLVEVHFTTAPSGPVHLRINAQDATKEGNQRAPGLFVAHAVASASPLRLEVEADGRRWRFAEAEGSSAPDLGRLASETGGQLTAWPQRPAPDAAVPMTDTDGRMLPLRPWLILIAIILFLADIAWRRRPFLRVAS